MHTKRRDRSGPPGAARGSSHPPDRSARHRSARRVPASPRLPPVTLFSFAAACFRRPVVSFSRRAFPSASRATLPGRLPASRRASSRPACRPRVPLPFASPPTPKASRAASVPAPPGPLRTAPVHRYRRAKAAAPDSRPSRPPAAARPSTSCLREMSCSLLL